MELRLKIGRYAGEIRDVAPDVAHQMIADGRATDPRFESEVQVSEPATQFLAVKKKGRR